MYCGSGNIREVLILVNFLRGGQILIRELKKYRENSFYNSATKET